MVFVWCQSINPLLRYDNVNIWQKWPWRSRSIDPIFDRVLKGPQIHILCANGDSSSNPWRVIACYKLKFAKIGQFKSKMTLKVKVIDPIFNRVLKGPKIHILCENGVSRSNPCRVMAQTSSNLRKSTQFKSKMTLKVKVNQPHFQ